MTEQQVDSVPVKDLWIDYNVGRTKFYSILTELKIKTTQEWGRSYISGEEKARLDKYFSLPEDSRERWLSEQSGRSDTDRTEIVESESPREFALQLPQLESLNQTLEKILSKSVDETATYRQLFYFANNGVRIPSSVVRSLTGKKPKGENWYWGNFKFVKVLPQDSPEDKGRIGREQSWIVVKR